MNKIVLAFALLTCACSAAPRHVSLERWQSDLELHIQTTRAQATPGERLPVQFRIANHGRERAVACRYSTSAVHLFGIDERYVKSRLGPVVDHQYCEIRVVVAPDQFVEWTEEIEVPEVPPGNAQVMAHVRLVDPSDCDHYGCYDTLLSAESAQPLRISTGG